MENIPIQVSRGCVVASIQMDLSDELINLLRTMLLEKIQQVNAKAVILDLSGLEVVDPLEFGRLVKTLDMAQLMGAFPVISGLKPSIICSLILLDTDITGVHGSLDLDHAFEFVEAIRVSDHSDAEEVNQVQTEIPDIEMETSEQEQGLEERTPY